MSSQRMWLVRAGLLLIGIPLLLWVVELSLGILNKARQYTTIAQDSEAVIDGFRFFIESAEWKDGLLQITCCREDVERGKPMWGRAALLLCHFWDAEGVKIPGWVAASDEKVREPLVLGVSKTERQQVTIRVPEEAESFAIEFGFVRTGWATKIVPIPLRPVELSLKGIKQLMPR